MSRPRWLPAMLAIVSLCTAAAVAVGAISNGTPDQATNDQSAADSGFPGARGLWGDLSGGVAARPYVLSLSVINDGTATPVISNGTAAAPATQTGDVTAVVAPFNLCRAGQAPQPGECFSSPNRVGITMGYASLGNVATDFAHPDVPLRQVVDQNTIFDMRVRLNTLGKTLRWTWVNGDLAYWSATNLGQDDAEVHIQFRPVITPAIDWSLSPNNGCTATPIRDCDIPQSQGETLSANLVLSLDHTLNASLTGAVFATQGAVSGYLEPGGSAVAPELHLEIASAHATSTGAPQTGELKALIPAQSLVNLYGVLPSDASSFFTTTRTGDPGTQSPPTFARWTAAGNGTDGLLIGVSNITFSAPTYAVARKTPAPTTSARRGRKGTTVKAAAVRSCRMSACTATIFRIASRVTGATTRVGSARTSASGALTAVVPTRRLRAGSRYMLVLRYASGGSKGKLVTTAVGTTS